MRQTIYNKNKIWEEKYKMRQVTTEWQNKE